MNESITAPDVVLRVSRLRYFLMVACSLSIGFGIAQLLLGKIYDVEGIINDFLPMIGVAIAVSLINTAIWVPSFDVTLSGTNLRAPIRKGWWLTPVEIDLSEIDLPASRASWLWGSFLKTQDGRSLLIYRHSKKDVEKLFEEVRKRVECRNHG